MILMFVYIPMYFSSLKYTVTDDAFIAERGVIIRRKNAVKLEAVQSIAAFIPRYRLFSWITLAELNVYGGVVRIIFMDKKDIEELIMHIEADNRRKNGL